MQVAKQVFDRFVKRYPPRPGSIAAGAAPIGCSTQTYCLAHTHRPHVQLMRAIGNCFKTRPTRSSAINHPPRVQCNLPTPGAAKLQAMHARLCIVLVTQFHWLSSLHLLNWCTVQFSCTEHPRRTAKLSGLHCQMSPGHCSECPSCRSCWESKLPCQCPASQQPKQHQLLPKKANLKL